RFPEGNPCFVGAPTADDVNGATMIYAAAAPAPTATPTPGPVCGDVNGDGSLTIDDADQVLAAAAGLPTCAVQDQCDVDGTGEGDAANAQRRAWGLPGASVCRH